MADLQEDTPVHRGPKPCTASTARRTAVRPAVHGGAQPAMHHGTAARRAHLCAIKGLFGQFVREVVQASPGAILKVV